MADGAARTLRQDARRNSKAGAGEGQTAGIVAR
jgi:hypothetical protein